MKKIGDVLTGTEFEKLKENLTIDPIVAKYTTSETIELIDKQITFEGQEIDCSKAEIAGRERVVSELKTIKKKLEEE